MSATPSAYFEMLELSEEENHQLFLPAKDAAFPDKTFITRWRPMSGGLGKSLLSVKLIPNNMTNQTVPVSFASHKKGCDRTR
jgi:hypothetical protein